MSFLRRLLTGAREADHGRPGYYVEADGLLVYRAVQGGPLVPVGGGGGGAASPLTLTAGGAAETPLTIIAHGGQSVEALIVKSDDTTQNTFAVKNAAGDWAAFVVSGEGATYIYPFAADQVPLTLGAFIGQAANLFEVYDENSDLVVHVSAGGDVIATTAITAPYFTGRLVGQVSGVSSDPTQVPVTIGGGAISQTANLVEVYSDDGNDLLFAIFADGTVHIKTGGSVQADL